MYSLNICWPCLNGVRGSQRAGCIRTNEVKRVYLGLSETSIKDINLYVFVRGFYPEFSWDEQLFLFPAPLLLSALCCTCGRKPASRHRNHDDPGCSQPPEVGVKSIVAQCVTAVAMARQSNPPTPPHFKHIHTHITLLLQAAELYLTSAATISIPSCSTPISTQPK